MQLYEVTETHEFEAEGMEKVPCIDEERFLQTLLTYKIYYCNSIHFRFCSKGDVSCKTIIWHILVPPRLP